MAEQRMHELREISARLRDARERTLALVDDLDDGQLVVPELEIVNPFLWELGHVAWFQEKWCLRHLAGLAPLRADGDALYDSSAVPHAARWRLPIPDRAATLEYLRAVLERVLERLERSEPTTETLYFHRLALFHEDMHGEAFTYTRQTLALPPPRFSELAPRPGPSVGGDVELEGGTFELGAPRELAFVFDNEKWAHAVEVRPFAVARVATTQGEFADFVDDGGYRRRELWSDAGWAWRERAGVAEPLDWRRDSAGWLRRVFDRWLPLERDAAMVHVNWHEARAWCRWAGRRLPSEAEWELAARSGDRRPFPWGDDPPEPERAALDGELFGPLDASAFPAGDTPSGIRQMLGNVWEWCEDAFRPYPEFAADPYTDYSRPWFGTHRVLRGGCGATRARLIRTTWRNFYEPHRRDVFAGFRTAAAP